MKKKNQASSVAIIGGADGPTAIFSMSKKSLKKQQQKQEQILLWAKKHAKPSRRSFSELEEYLKEKWGAYKNPLSQREEEMIKTNVILNSYPELVGAAAKPPEQDASEQEWKEYLDRDMTSFDLAREYPAEKLGLVMKSLVIPKEKAKILRGMDSQNLFYRFALRKIPGEMVVNWEEKSEHLSVKNGCQSVMDLIAVFLGVSEEDIALENDRFVAYAYALHQFRNGKRCDRFL